MVVGWGKPVGEMIKSRPLRQETTVQNCQGSVSGRMSGKCGDSLESKFSVFGYRM